MHKATFLLSATVFLISGAGLLAEPPAKNEQTSGLSKTTNAPSRTPTRAQIIQSANGWTYLNGEWVHPDGYKFVNRRIIRTTAKSGKGAPKPPGKLAVENPTKVPPPARSATALSKDNGKTDADKAAAARRKNLTPPAASQTGTHL